MKSFGVILAFVIFLTGCERLEHFNQMEDHGRVKPYEPIPLTETSQSARPLPAGTVSRDQQLYIDNPVLVSGRSNGILASSFPMPITRQLLDRGQQRYEIYCAPCHGLTGDGNGMVVQRGFVPPPSFHIDRLREIPVGHFVDVISNGWGAMFSYNDRVNPQDRWAIAAYIRALQLSQHAPISMLTADDRQHLLHTPGGQQ